jgi:restriction system protein
MTAASSEPAPIPRAQRPEVPQISSPPAGAPVPWAGPIQSQAAPGRSIDDLIANTGGRGSAAANIPPPERLTADSQEISPRIWVPAACLGLFVTALGGFALVRRRPRRPEKHMPALETALGEIRAHAPALRAARLESMQPDRYGTVHADGWEREKALFVNSRVMAQLRAAGYHDMPSGLLAAIDAEIESCAKSVADSSPSGAYAGLDPAGGSMVPDIDPGLSVYATRCTSLLRDAGWRTEPEPPAATGKAIDILAERDGRTLLLQCKGDGSPVGVEAVQEVFNRKDRRKVDIAAIVTHAPFTRAAQQLASANGVHAVHDDGLMLLIQ